jgi:branched-chain amino acid transport system substrate-binding protein
MRKRMVFGVGMGVLAIAAGLSGMAQDMGVTKTKIKIGTWGPTSGPFQQFGRVMLGIEALVNKVNREGGINGRQIELLKRDDGYDPARTKLVVNELINRQGVFALVGGVGTANGAAILNDIRANQIPWVSPATGSTLFSQVRNGQLATPTVFASYTNYVIESILLLRHGVNTLKLDKVAVAYVNNAFGAEGLAGVEAEINSDLKGKATLVAKVSHEQTESNLAVQALRLKQSGAEAVVLYTAGDAMLSLLREMAKIDYKPQILASSVVAGAILQAGPNTQANGAIIASYIPIPTAALADGKNGDARADAAFAELLKLAPDAVRADPLSTIAGWAFAEPLIEGLKRTGPNLNRPNFVKAMESINNWKGSLFNSLSYSPTDRQGNNSVFLVRGVYAPRPGFVAVGGWVSFNNER